MGGRVQQDVVGIFRRVVWQAFPLEVTQVES
jgi:hypothetical protein